MAIGESRRSPGGVASAPMTARSVASGSPAVASARTSRSASGSGPKVDAFRPADRASKASGASGAVTSVGAPSRHASVASGRSQRTAGGVPAALASPGATPSGTWPNMQIEISPWSGQHSPNFQKFRKKEPDPSKAVERRVLNALAGSDMAELQEVYRILCAREGPTFLVESRLVAKVVHKMQKLALDGLRKRVQSCDIEACRAYLERIDQDPMLGALMKSEEASKARIFLRLMEAVVAAQEAASSKDGKRESPVEVQKDCLQALKDVLRRAELAGIDHALLQRAQEVERRLSAKLRALIALRSAVASQDLEDIEKAVVEAERQGVASAEVQVHKNVLADVKLQSLVQNVQTENLRSLLKEIQKNGGMGIDDAKIQNAWRTVHHEDLIEAMRSNDMKKLRIAIAYAQAAGLKGEMARTLTCAEKRIEEAQALEAANELILQRLQSAVLSRDIDRIRNALAEADDNGLRSPLMGRAEVVMCEEELRTAASIRAVPRIKVKVVEGIELGIDKTIIDCGMHILDVDDPKAAAWARIRQAIHCGDPDALRTAIDLGKSAGLDEAEVDEAQGRLLEVQVSPKLKLQLGFEEEEEEALASASQDGPEEEASPFGDGASVFGEESPGTEGQTDQEPGVSPFFGQESPGTEGQEDREDALRRVDAILEEEGAEEEEEEDYEEEEEEEDE
eukprot:CAMPEP_0176044108 /NCGR_PEP_ID=MMETSP0120_2-20121206/21891_1 /TAXON_ID=160619 /ORGANISM="Kryptoperidinium foliaceum, Strain CCMP 1326" /LENGTH=680 /DNA_ID=CAMNT_0017377515 /DNA_START=36 /DNA_END=2075 /DNA_ORIENTATION=-